VNTDHLHVHAADVLVRCGIHREGFRQPPIGAPASGCRDAVRVAPNRVNCARLSALRHG
jgi:hypothetical protein